MARCDQDKCPLPPLYRCRCRRCDREDDSGAFFACDDHAFSEQIRDKHRHIYPAHTLSFLRFVEAPVQDGAAEDKEDLSVMVPLSKIVAWLEAPTEPGSVGLHFQNTCKFLVRQLRSGSWRSRAK